MKANLVYAILCMVLFVCSASVSAVDVDAFLRKDKFETIKISPGGGYVAATVPLGDTTALVIMHRTEFKITATFKLSKNTHVNDFWWVSPERVLIRVARKFGELDQPRLTGELYGIDADGGKAGVIVGPRATGDRIAAFLVDDLPADDKHVIISARPFSSDPYTTAEKMDVYTGRRFRVARAPVRNADFVTDNSGEVRFARGAGIDNVSKLYYRGGSGEAWKLINDEAVSNRIELPLGFSADNANAYLQIEHDKGPDSIVAMDIASGTRKQVLRDDDTDPERIIYRTGTSIPVGAVLIDGKTRAEFFDPVSPEARQYRSLQAAFPGQFPFITSSTADGKLALVRTHSDRNPGDFYIFDTVAKKASHLISRRDWFDPAKMAEMRPVSFAARDGLPLKGYLTVPPGSDGKSLSMVVMPHGGPFGIFDTWEFGDDSQLLAAAGYAVLQVNFRGSGNHGRAFRKAGARQWGGRMQDDITDATRWAIEQGIADPRRICIFGGSYGGYAALMGVAKEPALYRCAVGYVGVYDLPTMHTHGDVQQYGSGETFLREWIGDRDALAAVSPNRMADRIKVPVFLAAGGEDQRAPIEHSRMMEKALKSAGVPVETLYYPTEGHGFYVEANRREFYTKLLAFLNRHIGGATATATAAK